MDKQKKEPKKNPHEHHRQRFKQKYIENQYRFDYLTAHQICELLLFFSYPRGDVNLLGHALWDKFGSFRRIIDASPEELAEVVSPNSVTLIKLISQLVREYHAGNYTSKTNMLYNSYALQAKFFTEQYTTITEECICVLCLDSQFRYLKHTMFESGIVNAAQIDTKQLISFVLSTKATVVLLAHNHPNADLRPSNQDILTTSILQRLFMRLNIVLYDHIIVSGQQALSLKQAGYFEQLEQSSL